MMLWLEFHAVFIFPVQSRKSTVIVDCVGVKKKLKNMGDETLQAVGRIGNGSLLSWEIRIIKAVYSMQNKMLFHILAVEI